MNLTYPENNQLADEDARFFLAAIIESSQDSIVSIDLDRNITTWNRAAETLYGYSAAEVIGKPLSIVLLPKDIHDLMGRIDDISHEVSVPLFDTVRVHKSGKHIDLQIGLSPVRNSAGEVIGVSTIARDITLPKLQEQIKDEFIAIASHELKTPVTSMKAYGQLLMQNMTSASDKRHLPMLGKLNGQIDRLIELIKTLLDTTKLSAGQVLLSKQDFDICTVIEEQLEIIRNTSPHHTLSFSNKKEIKVFADRKLIGQAISNLVSNAIKYSAHGREVIILAEMLTDSVVVSVQDFGVGIAQEQTDQIFERYFRVNSVRNSDIPGIGLGLYITAQIIHQHGGTIKVTSKIKEGSIFSFELPVAKID